MVITTTPTIEGHPVREYKGVVTGETIIGANVIKDFMASLTDFFGGRSGQYESTSTMRQWDNPAPCSWFLPAAQLWSSDLRHFMSHSRFSSVFAWSES